MHIIPIVLFGLILGAYGTWKYRSHLHKRDVLVAIVAVAFVCAGINRFIQETFEPVLAAFPQRVAEFVWYVLAFQITGVAVTALLVAIAYGVYQYEERKKTPPAAEPPPPLVAAEPPPPPYVDVDKKIDELIKRNKK